MTKFYIDVDDTLADFQSYAIERGIPPWTGTWYTNCPTTWTDEQRDIQARTNALMESEDFWANIPLMPGAFEILTAAAMRGETYLLTAYPRTCPDKEMVKRVKIEWAVRNLHFPADRVIVCDRPDKTKYATTREAYMATTDVLGGRSLVDSVSPNVLVDDAAKNCEEWAEAGGVAILYHARTPTALADTLAAIKGIKRG